MSVSRPYQTDMLATPSNCGKILKLRIPRLVERLSVSRWSKDHWMVRTSEMEQWTIRSQVLTLERGMDAVHRLNGGG